MIFAALLPHLSPLAAFAVDGRGFALPLAVCAALFLLVAPGAAGLALFDLAFNRKRAAWGRSLIAAEWLFVTVVASILTTLWFGLILAELRLFSVGAVLAVVAVYSAAVLGLYVARRGNPARNVRAALDLRRPAWTANVQLGLLLLLAGVLFFRPHETILGVQDSGVYYMAGANIERTGGFIIDDPFVRELAAFDAGKTQNKVVPQFLAAPDRSINRYLFTTRLRQAGFYIQPPLPLDLAGMDATTKDATLLADGKVVPQFMPLSQVLIATLIGIFGLFGGFYSSPLVMFLAVWALYLFVRRAMPALGGLRLAGWLAPLATLFCILNSIEVWFARETLWEASGQFLLFTAFWGFALFMSPQADDAPQVGRWLGGTVSGVAFGMLGLAHVQAPLFWLPLFVWLIYARLTRRLTRADLFFWLPFALLVLHGLIHVFIFALAYAEGIYHHPILDSIKRAPIYVPLAVAAILAFVLLDRMTKRMARADAWLRQPRTLGRLLLAAAVLVFGYLAYGYIIRPGLLSPGHIIGTLQDPARLAAYTGSPIFRIANNVKDQNSGNIASDLVTKYIAQTNLLRLGWYFLPLGMLLAFFGVAAMIARRMTPALTLFVTIAIAVSVFFVDQSYTTPNFIYSARRFVPITVPAFSIFIAYAVIAWLPALWDWLIALLRRFKPAPRVSQPQVALQAAGGLRLPNVMFASIAQQSSDALSHDGMASPPQTPRLRQPGVIGGLLLALVMVAFFLYTGRTIMHHIEYDGALDQISALAAQIGPKDITVFCCTRDEDGKFSAPLTYVYGRTSFVINGGRPNNDTLGKLFAQWQSEGHTIKLILGTNGGRLSPVGFDVGTLADENITLTQFEELAAQKPYNVITPPIVLTYGLYSASPRTATATTAPGFGTGSPTAPDGWHLAMGPLDYAALGGGFYDRETDQTGTTFRWTTADPGQLRLPCIPAGKSGTISLTLSGGNRPPVILRNGPATTTVWLSDNVYTKLDTAPTPPKLTLGTLTLDSTPQTYTFSVPAGAPVLAGCATGRDSTFIVNMSVPKETLWIPADAKVSNDPRQLGIAVINVALKAQ